jgi:hypothetical protein
LQVHPDAQREFTICTDDVCRRGGQADAPHARQLDGGNDVIQ